MQIQIICQYNFRLIREMTIISKLSFFHQSVSQCIIKIDINLHHIIALSRTMRLKTKLTVQRRNVIY